MQWMQSCIAFFLAPVLNVRLPRLSLVFETTLFLSFPFKALPQSSQLSRSARNGRKNLDPEVVWQTFLTHLYQLSSSWPHYFLGFDQGPEFCAKIGKRSRFSRALSVANSSRWFNLIQMVSTKTLTKTLTKSLEFNGLSQIFKVKNLVLNPFQLLLRVPLILFKMPSTKGLESPRFFLKKAFILVLAESDCLIKEQRCKLNTVGADNTVGFEIIFALYLA